MLDILVLAPFSETAKESFARLAGDKCRFTYSDKWDGPCDGYDIVWGNPSQTYIADAGEKLKWVQLLTSGTDRYNIDFPKNVLLTNATGVFGNSISQYAVGCVLALCGRFPRYITQQRKHQWKLNGFGTSLTGKRALILGAGDIGTQTACRLRPFDMTIVGIKRSLKTRPQGFDEIYTMEVLEDELRKADVIVCCLPATAETKKLLDARRIAMIKDGAVIVNVGRGSLIDTDALIDALDSGHIFGAALDVTDPEPLNADSKLWDMDNVIITPHISGPSLNEKHVEREEIENLCLENLRRYLNGETMINNVNLELGYAAK